MNDEIVLYALYDKMEDKSIEKLTFFLCYQDYVNNGEIILGQYQVDSKNTLALDFSEQNDFKYQTIVFELMKQYGLSEIIPQETKLDNFINNLQKDDAWKKIWNYVTENEIDLVILEPLHKPNLKVYKN